MYNGPRVMKAPPPHHRGSTFPIREIILVTVYTRAKFLNIVESVATAAALTAAAAAAAVAAAAADDRAFDTQG